MNRATQPKRRAHSSAKPVKPAKPALKPPAHSAATVRKPQRTSDKSGIVLLAVTGMSPAVLTETLWALANEEDPTIPDRVLVITTSTGRQSLVDLLFSPCARFQGLSPWDALRQALERSGHDLRGKLRFGTTANDIRVITAPDPASGLSRELADLRNPADHEATADFLLEQVRGIVETPDTHLIASIAGGRKTMGALLYACLTLAGRETDRLTHVLVNEPFETLREFFFPAQPGGPLISPQSSAPIAPSNARVELADVPFVPLRNLFVRELGRKAGTFATLVDTCRENIRARAGVQLRLQIETTRAELDINGTKVKLAPLEHLLLLFLARRAKQNEPAFGAYAEAVDPLNDFRVQLLSNRADYDFADWRHADSLRTAWDEQAVRKAASGIRTKLRAVGGNAPLLAACLPEKGRCSLSVPGELIFIKDTAT